MKIAINQPYIFPYLGYFHLIHAADKFVFLDDVNYINKGWVNRNRIISPDKKTDHLFTIPLRGAGQNKKINELLLHDNFNTWRASFAKTFDYAYAKAPYYAIAKNIVFTLLTSIGAGSNISDVAKASVQICADYLGMKKQWANSSSYKNEIFKKGDRLIDICKKDGANHYINAIGGQELYKKEDFMQHDIHLWFINSLLKPYREPCLLGLSIIDLIAYCNPQTLQEQLLSYHLVGAL